MTKRKRAAELKGIDGEAILAALQARAAELAAALSHRLGEWTSAKHKHGKGSKKAICLVCGDMAVIMPRGNGKAKGEAGRLPGIKGDAIWARCGTPALSKMEVAVAAAIRGGAKGRML